DKHLLLIRKQFVDQVSVSTLNQLLDSLFQQGIINMEEMDSARIKPRLDPYLSETLHEVIHLPSVFCGTCLSSLKLKVILFFLQRTILFAYKLLMSLN
uniref:CARD domain-containing protein n=1 Tax=Oreochromis aureus TaxID=47969 RepID=A0AAZ1XXR5_OREAU